MVNVHGQGDEYFYVLTHEFSRSNHPILQSPLRRLMGTLSQSHYSFFESLSPRFSACPEAYLWNRANERENGEEKSIFLAPLIVRLALQEDDHHVRDGDFETRPK